MRRREHLIWMCHMLTDENKSNKHFPLPLRPFNRTRKPYESSNYSIGNILPLNWGWLQNFECSEQSVCLINWWIDLQHCSIGRSYWTVHNRQSEKGRFFCSCDEAVYVCSAWVWLWVVCVVFCLLFQLIMGYEFTSHTIYLCWHTHTERFQNAMVQWLFYFCLPPIR